MFLPSGGSLVIDRTEAMTVVDVNTGKYTGSGGNLEETVTKNNLEPLKRSYASCGCATSAASSSSTSSTWCSRATASSCSAARRVPRQRPSRHQVAEVTSLGLVQMTRKRIGTGLLKSFSHECEHCNGRGVVIADAPVEPKKEEQRRGSRGGRGGGGGNGGGGNGGGGGGRGGAANGPGGRGGARKNDDASDSGDTKNDAKADSKPRQRRGRGQG